MKKDEAIASLKSACAAHERWVEFGKFLVDGIILDEVQVPLNAKECVFGRWLKAAGQYAKNIPGFNEIKELHEKFHQLYAALYRTAQSIHKSRGVFTRKKVIARQDALLLTNYESLQKQSFLLIQKLAQLEKSLSSMSQWLFGRNIYMLS